MCEIQFLCVFIEADVNITVNLILLVPWW